MEKEIDAATDDNSQGKENIGIIIQQKPRPLDIKELNLLYRILNGKYPNVINKRKPLAKGIMHEIQEELRLELETVAHFCKWYCGINYKKLLKEGASRYNLQGEITGTVTKEEEAGAKALVERRLLLTQRDGQIITEGFKARQEDDGPKQ